MSQGAHAKIADWSPDGEAPVFGRRAAGTVSKIAADRRRHKRVPLTTLGRFMRENRKEHPCRLRDVSIGGAAIIAPVDMEIGERVLAYFDHLGGLEGRAIRVFDGGFALQFTATVHKRERLAAQLTYLINRPHLGSLADRRHERIVPQNAAQSLTLLDGLTITCRVVDVSLTGASIETPARPHIGMDVKLGAMRARVVRHHANGIAVAFADVMSVNALKRTFS